jgi:glycosyltransferase involved in cell wall biosynthesis
MAPASFITDRASPCAPGNPFTLASMTIERPPLIMGDNCAPASYLRVGDVRILIATDQYAPMVGGVPTVTGTLARGLAGRGHSVLVLAPSQGWRAATGADAASAVHYLGSVPWPFYAGARLARLPVRAVTRLLDAFAPEVVHAHSPLVLGCLARRRAERRGIPVVYTNHYLPVNVSPSFQPPGLAAAVYSCVVGFANRCAQVTAPSATALRLLRERGLRAPSRVISNGVDVTAYAPGPADDRLRTRYRLPRDRPLILSVSRLSPEKGITVLLDAAARLTRPAHLVIAGTGPQERRLRARAQRLGLAGRVTFPGYVPGADLPGLYRLADVFVTASQAELQGLTTMDAMASGLPVVAADACALRELVRHGGNGLLFRPGDAGQLAACLDALTGDRGRRARMAVQSLAIISGHDRQRVVTEWESLYATLAAGERERRS